jgi:hypothetical protein
MKVVKLTKKAQDIVNQIMSADAVDIDYGVIDERLYYGQIHLTGEGLKCDIDNGDVGELMVSNESLNAAVITCPDGTIEIDAKHFERNNWCMTITLYKLSKLAAV